jgi:beta-lactamase regulating signal transducer with metallopeptidase domain
MMTLQSAAQLCSSTLVVLGDAAIRSVALALIGGLALKLFRVKETSLRMTTSAGLLYAALAMPVLALVVPSIQLRMLPGRSVATAAGDRSQSPRSAIARDDPIQSEGGPATQAHQLAVKQRVADHQTFDAGTRRASGMPLLYLGPMSATPLAATPADSTMISSAISSPSPRPSAPLIPWPVLAIVLYSLVAVFLLTRVTTGFVLGRRLRKRAQPIVDADIASLMGEIRARRQGGHIPPVAESTSISVPASIGTIHPVILLPAGWKTWERQKLLAVLAHELSHADRRDGLTQLISALHRCFFWFSPLPWWLHRRLVDLAEQASDDSALMAVHDRAFYAEVLLGFFRSVSAAPGRWLGVSMARGARAGRRVERILADATGFPRTIKKAVVAAIVVAIVPLALVAASVRFVQRSSDQTAALGTKRAGTLNKTPKTNGDADTGTSNTTAPESVQSGPGGVIGGIPGGIDGGVPGGVTGGVLGGIPGGINAGVPGGITGGVPDGVPGGIDGAVPGGVTGSLANIGLLGQQQPPPPPANPDPPPAAPVPPAITSVPGPAAPVLAPEPPLPPPAPFALADQDLDAWESTRGNRDSYVIMTDGDTLVMAASERDIQHARSLRNKIKGDFIWFRHGGRGYIITDPATIKAAKDLFSRRVDGTKGYAALLSQQAKGYGDLWAKEAEPLRKQAEALAKQQAKSFYDQAEQISRTTGLLNKQQEDLLGKEAEKQAELLAKQAERIGQQSQSLCSGYLDKVLKICELEVQIKGTTNQEARARLQDRMSELKSKLRELQQFRVDSLQPKFDELQAELREMQSKWSGGQSDLAQSQAAMAREFAKHAEQFKMLQDHSMKQLQLQQQQKMRELQKSLKGFRPFMTNAQEQMRQMIDQALQSGVATPEQ